MTKPEIMIRAKRPVGPGSMETGSAEAIKSALDLVWADVPAKVADIIDKRGMADILIDFDCEEVEMCIMGVP